MKYLYGYAVGHPDEQCAIDPGSPTRTLCGRAVGFLPAHDEDYTPRNLHSVCRDRVFGRATQPKADRGICPACHGDAPVSKGRIMPHGEVRVGVDGEPYESEVRCVGVNMRPMGGKQ